MKWLRRCFTKRTLLVLLLFIVGGAIINVAVAWGIASPTFWNPMYMPAKEVDSGFFHYDGWEWHFSVRQSPGFRLTNVRPLRTRFMMKPEETRDVIGEIIPIWNRNKQANMFFTYELGWPIRSYGYALGYQGDLDKIHGMILHGGSSLWHKNQEPGNISARGQFAALPLIPIWPGFAINTIFYAVTLWMLFTAPGFVRRCIRIMCHRCPACGYLIGTSPVCTECGTPVTPQTIQQ